MSEVRGRLRAGLDALAALAACFPAGTVSGAPKVRAMEIIDELEPVRRGPYAGAVGYVGWGARTLDTAIAHPHLRDAGRPRLGAGGRGHRRRLRPRRRVAGDGGQGAGGAARARLGGEDVTLSPWLGRDFPSMATFRLVSASGDQSFELSEIAIEKCKSSQLTAKLSSTPQEASRHLMRLHDAKLREKDSDGFCYQTLTNKRQAYLNPGLLFS